MNGIWKKKLNKHKIALSQATLEEDHNKFIYVEKSGKELSLVFNRFKCGHCSATERLQYHHLIQRPMKYYMDFWLYRSQRNYWGNVIILCVDCHRKVEGKIPVPINSGSNTMTIPQGHIDKMRKKYETN